MLPELKPADIILFSNQNTNFISDGIKWFTSSKWNHVGMSDGKGNLIHNTMGGKQKEDLFDFFRSHNTKIAVLRMNLPDKLRQRIVETADKTVGKWGYGYKSYAGLSVIHLLSKAWNKLYKMIRRNPNPYWQENDPVCSNTIALDYRKEGIELFPHIHVSQVTPQDWWENKHMKKIYSEV